MKLSRVFLILATVAMVMLYEHSHQKSPEALRREFELFVNEQGGKLATATEMEAITKTHNFRCHSDPFGGTDLYLFCPTPEVNVAVLDRMMEKPGIADYNTNVIPMPAKDSPVTEKAAGMCLLDSTIWSAADLVGVAPTIVDHKSEVESAWSSLSDKDKAFVSKSLAENKSVCDRLGGAKVLVIFDKQGFLFRDWRRLDSLKEYGRGTLFGF